MKKKGSALVIVLVITTALLILGIAVSAAVINTTKLNAKYSDNIDLELAAKSGLNIVREDLISNANNIEEINNYFSSSNIHEGNMDTLYTESSKIRVEYKVSKIENKVILYSKAINRNNNRYFKEEEQIITLNVEQNTPEAGGVVDLLRSGSVFVSLGSNLNKSAYVRTEYGANNKLPNGIWHIQQKDNDLDILIKKDQNDSSIQGNYYPIVNNYNKTNTIIASGFEDIVKIQNNLGGDFILQNDEYFKAHLSDEYISKQSNTLFNDNKGTKIYHDGDNKRVVGIIKKIENINVVLIDGNIRFYGNDNLENAFIYATGNIEINVGDLKASNSMIIAGKKLSINTNRIERASSISNENNLKAIEVFINKIIND